MNDMVGAAGGLSEVFDYDLSVSSVSYRTGYGFRRRLGGRVSVAS